MFTVLFAFHDGPSSVDNPTVFVTRDERETVKLSRLMTIGWRYSWLLGGFGPSGIGYLMIWLGGGSYDQILIVTSYFKYLYYRDSYIPTYQYKNA